MAGRRKLVAGSSQFGLSPEEGSSLDDPDIVEVSPSAAVAWGSDDRKQKRSRIDPHDVVEIIEDGHHNEDEDIDADVIIGEGKPDYKNKQPIQIDEYLQKQVKDAFSNDLVGSSKNHGSTHDAPSGGGLVDLSYTEEVEYDPSDYDEDEYNDDDDDDDGYDALIVESDGDSDLAAKFEDMDLPPGVEATVPWMQKSKSAPDEIDLKYKAFKQFDTVQDDSDHYFRVPNDPKKSPATKPSKDWVKKIQNEWKLLEKDLPGEFLFHMSVALSIFYVNDFVSFISCTCGLSDFYQKLAKDTVD